LKQLFTSYRIQVNSVLLIVIKLSNFLQQSTEEKNDENNRDVTMEDSFGEWEDMSIDMVHWNELSKQLEDLSYLSRLVHYQPQMLQKTNAENLNLSIPDVSDNLDFSLSTILQKGRGMFDLQESLMNLESVIQTLILIYLQDQ